MLLYQKSDRCISQYEIQTERGICSHVEIRKVLHFNQPEVFIYLLHFPPKIVYDISQTVIYISSSLQGQLLQLQTFCFQFSQGASLGVLCMAVSPCLKASLSKMVPSDGQGKWICSSYVKVYPSGVRYVRSINTSSISGKSFPSILTHT